MQNPHLDATRDDESESTATPICPNCMTPTTSTAAVCGKCNMPIGAFATYDPIEQIRSTGWMYRRAIGGGISKMAFIGMWLIFGPTTLVLIFVLCSIVFYPTPTVSLLHFSITILFTFLQVMILYLVTKSYLKYRNRRVGHCEECGYNLSHLTEPRCPECGSRFDPDWDEDATESTATPGNHPSSTDC